MSEANNLKILPSIYLTHGGGPCFFMDWNPPGVWDKMGDWLKNLSKTLPYKPKSILVISAHWEEDEFTLMTSPNPKLIYDYFGFPEHTYELTYDAPGNPELANKVKNILEKNNIPVKPNKARGFDHGVFIPLKLIFPEANIPVLQLSLKKNLDPQDHIQLGKALAELRSQGILIIGSGSSYHNLSSFNEKGKEVSEVFDQWLTETVSNPNRSEREEALTNWKQAPLAKQAHPREEHLIPLMVVAGSALDNESGYKLFSDSIMGLTLSAFAFG